MVFGGFCVFNPKDGTHDLSWTRPSGVSGCRCHSQVSYSTAMSACAKGKAVWDFFGGQVLNNMCQGVGWLWSIEINSHANDDQHQMQLFTPSCGWPQTTHWKQIGQLSTCWMEFTKLTTAQFGGHLQASGDMWWWGVVMICPRPGYSVTSTFFWLWKIPSSTCSYALRNGSFMDLVTFFKQ